jgi:hypothetical protein
MGADEADAQRRRRSREHHPEAGQQPDGNSRPQSPHAHESHGSEEKTSREFPEVSQQAGITDIQACLT